LGRTLIQGDSSRKARKASEGKSKEERGLNPWKPSRPRPVGRVQSQSIVRKGGKTETSTQKKKKSNVLRRNEGEGGGTQVLR